MSTVTQTAPTGVEPTPAVPTAWHGFAPGPWQDAIDVRDFIQRNYTPYAGDAGFLAGPTERTTALWQRLTAMFPDEREKGVYDVDAATPATITAHAPRLHRRGERDHRRSADRRAAEAGDHAVRRLADGRGRARTPTATRSIPTSKKIFTTYRKTHNAGVFDVYPPAVKAARRSKIITGLPDAYGRGRIIGDYRRVALYGVDALIAAKHARPGRARTCRRSTEDVIRDREEIAEQIRALGELKADGGLVRVRHLRPGARPRGRPCSGCTSPIWRR